MTSHYAIFKQTLQQYDDEAQELERQIAELRIALLANRDGRLQYQRLMEKVFGGPEATVVMQRTDLVERRAEAMQITHEPEPERTRKQERDHKAYLQRKERELVKKRNGKLGPRERRLRSDAGKPKGSRQRYVDQVRQVFQDRPGAALRTGQVRDLVFPTRICTKREMNNVYMALHTLKKAGVLSQDHPGASYTLATGTPPPAEQFNDHMHH